MLTRIYLRVDQSIGTERIAATISCFQPEHKEMNNTLPARHNLYILHCYSKELVLCSGHCHMCSLQHSPVLLHGQTAFVQQSGAQHWKRSLNTLCRMSQLVYTHLPAIQAPHPTWNITGVVAEKRDVEVTASFEQLHQNGTEFLRSFVVFPLVQTHTL